MEVQYQMPINKQIMDELRAAYGADKSAKVENITQLKTDEKTVDDMVKDYLDGIITKLPEFVKGDKVGFSSYDIGKVIFGKSDPNWEDLDQYSRKKWTKHISERVEEYAKDHNIDYDHSEPARGKKFTNYFTKRADSILAEDPEVAAS